MKLTMKKNKIAGRLIGYFSSAFMVFALIIAGLFSILFKAYATEYQKKSLEERAVAISETLSGYMDTKGTKKQGKGAYFRFLDEIAMSDVWVVNSEYEFLTMGKHQKHLAYKELPEDGAAVIDSAMTGVTSFSQGFSEVLGTPVMTVGAPIFDREGKTIGVVLLHAPISDMSDFISEGRNILLISLAAAFLISIPFAFMLSLKFTRPLGKMKTTAGMLAKKDYTAKNHLSQKDEIGDLAKSMDILADRLAEAENESRRMEEMRREFAASVSHELRTPVTVLRGSLEALCDGIVEEEQMKTEYHQQMLRETLHLERLVNDLLELNRLQNPDFKIVFDAVDLRNLLADVVRSTRKLAEQKMITVTTDIQTDRGTIRGDYARLRQMLLIILENAVKFSSEKGEIKIWLLEAESCFEIGVKDTGIGILSEDIPYIFDRYYKNGKRQNDKGTGLGLAIAKQIALRHEAQIDVDSVVEKGSVFRFTFKKENSEEL